MPGGRRIRWASRLVSAAFFAFPREFRERYRVDALVYFRDRARGRLDRGGWPGLVRLVVVSVVNTVLAGLAERRSAWRAATRGSGLQPDVHAALRSLWRRPRFVLSAVVPVALGVAGVTGVFAVVDGVVLRPLPYEDPAALVAVGSPLQSGGRVTASTANLIDLEGAIPGLVVGGITGGSIVLKGDEPVQVRITRPTRAFMEIFRVKPALGRSFAEEDYASPRVALITWSFWQSRWGGDVSALGSVLEADIGDLRIIGILPRSWRPPEALNGSGGDLWIPVDYTASDLEVTRAFGFGSGVGRLGEGASLEAVNEQLAAAAVALWRAHPDANTERDGTPKSLEARPLHAVTVGDIGSRLAMLLGAVGLLLAIACANVANLFLARGAARERELAVRTVLGAGRGRLVTQLLVESTTVALIGGVIGLGLAYAGLDTLIALTPDLPLSESVVVDLRVAAASIVVSLASGVAFGLVPALTVSQRDPGGVLRGGSQPHRRADRLRGLLVVGQTALGLVLIVGGGLLVNSVVRLGLVEPGFRSEGVLTLRPRLNPRVYGGADAPATAFYSAFTDALSAVPSIRSVSGTMFVPGEGLPVSIRVTDLRTGDVLQRWRHTVLPGFFELLEIPIVEGRAFGPEDRPAGVRAVVIGETLARELWPGESPVGAVLRANDGDSDVEYRVIGVASDILDRGPHDPPVGAIYESFLQNPWLPAMSILVRHDGDAAGIVPGIRDALRGTDPSVPLLGVAPLTAILARNTAEERRYAILLSVFSLVALAIAAVGVYATTSYAVARRLREMGIRRAVGARGLDVAGLVVRRSLTEAGAGAAAGVLIALAAARTLDSLLFQITPSDPATYIAVVAILLGCAFIACMAPAVRAMRADPLAILRED